jgi:hypothetical protein
VGSEQNWLGTEVNFLRLEARAAAPLASDFLVAMFKKAFAFAILAFGFWFAGFLLHVGSNTKSRRLRT